MRLNRGLLIMKSIKVYLLATISLLLIVFVCITASAEIHNDFTDHDNYEMREPFSSSPLVVYPSLEASGVDA